MTAVSILVLLTAFQAKHLAADYLLQSGAMVRMKGTYGNLVGATHSMVHAGFTFVVLILFSPLALPVCAGIAVIEFLVHYHTDWAKDWITKRAGYKPHQKAYWAFVGLDQFFHQMTYVVIVWFVLFTV